MRGNKAGNYPAALRQENCGALAFLPALSLRACTALAVVLVGFYLWMIRPFVSVPADILMWGENGFVASIIKLQVGQPLYGAPGDSNSIIYTPFAPVVTYAISRLLGYRNSIPLWRTIQLGFVGCAALMGVRCWWLLRRLAYPARNLKHWKTWSLLVFLVLFLAGTSPEVNQFAHCLHTDSLALLVSMGCFWSMLRYLDAPNWKNMAIMAVGPSVGFMTKQLLVSWFAAMLLFIVLAHLVAIQPGAAPSSLLRASLEKGLSFAGLAGILLACTIGVCAWLWGYNFFFWIFEVMGGQRKHIGFSPGGYQLSIPRGTDHALRAWSELGIGVIGGLWVLKDRNIARLGPLWASWLLLVGSEILSSGAGWGVLYHFGPGVMIGCIWLLTAAWRWWPDEGPDPSDEFPRIVWFSKSVLAATGIVALFCALHVVPSGDQTSARYWKGRPPSPDLYRYVAEIENEFKGFAPGDVLLDIGNWVHLKPPFLARDQATSLGDQPPAGLFQNMDVFVEHIRAGMYKKILVREFDSPFFEYDWLGWPRSSGVRTALRDYYVEARRIRAAGGDNLLPPRIEHAEVVYVFVRKELAKEDKGLNR
jgi:hypothetical protein